MQKLKLKIKIITNVVLLIFIFLCLQITRKFTQLFSFYNKKGSPFFRSHLSKKRICITQAWICIILFQKIDVILPLKMTLLINNLKREK